MVKAWGHGKFIIFIWSYLPKRFENPYTNGTVCTVFNEKLKETKPNGNRLSKNICPKMPSCIQGSLVIVLLSVLARSTRQITVFFLITINTLGWILHMNFQMSFRNNFFMERTGCHFRDRFMPTPRFHMIMSAAFHTELKTCI